MLRILLRFFASKNSEQIVEKLSDSYLMRRFAQICVSVFYRGKSIAQEATQDRFKDLNRDKLNSFLDKFQNNLKEEAEKARKSINNDPKKWT